MYLKFGDQNLSHKRCKITVRKCSKEGPSQCGKLTIRISNVWINGVLLYTNIHKHNHAHIYTHAHALLLSRLLFYASNKSHEILEMTPCSWNLFYVFLWSHLFFANEYGFNSEDILLPTAWPEDSGGYPVRNTSTHKYEE